MHTYATSASERNWIPIAIGAISVLLAWLLSQVFARMHFQPPWWVEAPSVLGFYGILTPVFEKYLWHRKAGPLRSSIPNLHGTWVGHLTSSYIDPQTQKSATKTLVIHVHQEWRQILVKCNVGSSTSVSTMACIDPYDSNAPKVTYIYKNEPKALEVETMQIHYGVASLDVSSDGKTLKGSYFTGRGRGNYGEIELRLITREHLPPEKAIRGADPS